MASASALQRSQAKKTFVVNLMNRKGQTTGFKVSDYLKEIEPFYRRRYLRLYPCNDQKPPKELIEVYAEEGDLVENDLKTEGSFCCRFSGELKEAAKERSD